MIGQQHQRAADQIGGVLVVGRPGLAICRCSGCGDGCRIQHGRDHQTQDAAADHGAAVGGAGKGARIGAGRQRQHGDGAIDRRGTARGFGDGAHLVGDHAGNCRLRTDRRR